MTKADTYKNSKYRFVLPSLDNALIDDFNVSDQVTYDAGTAMFTLHSSNALKSVIGKQLDSFLKTKLDLGYETQTFIFYIKLHKDYFEFVSKGNDANMFPGMKPMLYIKHLNSWGVANFDVAHKIVNLEKQD